MSDHFSRRRILGGLGALFSVPFLTGSREALGQRSDPTASDSPPLRMSPLSSGNASVITPGIPTLPFTMDGDVKVFQLRSERVVIGPI